MGTTEAPLVKPGSKRGRAKQGRAVPEVHKGPGGWKKWNGSAICQTAYAPAIATSRTRSIAQGANHGHASHCEMFTAEMVLCKQNEYGKRLRDNTCEFYITNNMFDETKLKVAAPGGHTAKHRCTLAQACQITFKRTSEP